MKINVQAVGVSVTDPTTNRMITSEGLLVRDCVHIRRRIKDGALRIVQSKPKPKKNKKED